MSTTVAGDVDADPAQPLADALGVPVRWARPLLRAGVRSVEDMADWTLSDLRDVRAVGNYGVQVLAPAIRAAGVALPVVPRLPAADRRTATEPRPEPRLTPPKPVTPWDGPALSYAQVRAGGSVHVLDATETSARRGVCGALAAIRVARGSFPHGSLCARCHAVLMQPQLKEADRG